MQPGLIAVVRKDSGQPAGYVTAEQMPNNPHLIPDPEIHPDLEYDGTVRSDAPQPTDEEVAAAQADAEHLASQTRGTGIGVPAEASAITTPTGAHAEPVLTTSGDITSTAPPTTTTSAPSGSPTPSLGG